MIYNLQNDTIRVKADSKGAELKSIQKIRDSHAVEYLWQLNPEIWERQAPLLFPIIGRLKDEEYTFKGKTYNINIHGFARFAGFEASRKSDSEIEFMLKDSEGTLVCYPFKFRLIIRYKLIGNSIIKEHIIENKNETDMYYEIGGHEGYNLSLFDGESMEDYFIDFNGMKSIDTYTADEDIMIDKDKKTVELDSGRLYLSPEVFKNDALIVDEFINRKVSLMNTKNTRGIEVEFNDFKYLGIWSRYMRSDYVCIEPWSSLPDCNYLGKELDKKQNVCKVKAGEKDILSYTITVI